MCPVKDRLKRINSVLKRTGTFLWAQRLCYGTLQLHREREELPETVYGENGKPYFKDSDIHFNISHSGDYVVCALSPFETGCDIEKKSENGLKVAGRFAKREYDDIMSKKTDEEKTELFYRYWTLKEGYMKATGLGMRLALDSFEIVREEKISVIRDGIPEDCSFTEFDDIDGYACSVCVMRAEAGKAVLRTVDIEKIIRGWHL